MSELLTNEEPRSGRILLVDDDASMIILLTKLLQRAGYTDILGTSNPREVVERYREFKPDAVVLDLNMPDVSGHELIRKLTEIETQGYAPILVLTGSGEIDQKVEALKAGARDFLAKPFLAYELLARVKNMLEIHSLYVRTELKREILQLEVQQRGCEIVKAHHEILLRLGLACEFRDDDTGNHTRRIGDYAEILARKMELDESTCVWLKMASPMHDIGKVGIPDSILLKPGKLTPEEFDIIKTHTTIGAKILSGSDVPLLQAAQEIALTHHEKWDGSGYPARLAGEDIPLPGRLVAVCDVFDALLSVRPYKRAWSVEETVAEIQRCRGGHFDPAIVDAFLDVVPELVAIRAALV